VAGRSQTGLVIYDERVGNAQRGQVNEILSRALAEGYISLDEYEQRIQVVNNAKLASELMSQLRDLPQQFQWSPRMAPPPPPGTTPVNEDNARSFAIASLITGVASIPIGLCMVGGLLGIVAIVLSFPGAKSSTNRPFAIAGRVLGIVSIVLASFILVLTIFTPGEPAVS
jgi:hypothetical protein